MSLRYHYRKFQPRRLKFDQDMATNQWTVSHDSPVENMNDLELDFKVFFFVDS